MKLGDEIPHYTSGKDHTPFDYDQGGDIIVMEKPSHGLRILLAGIGLLYVVSAAASCAPLG